MCGCSTNRKRRRAGCLRHPTCPNFGVKVGRTTPINSAKAFDPAIVEHCRLFARSGRSCFPGTEHTGSRGETRECKTNYIRVVLSISPFGSLTDHFGDASNCNTIEPKVDGVGRRNAVIVGLEPRDILQCRLEQDPAIGRVALVRLEVEPMDVAQREYPLDEGKRLLLVLEIVVEKSGLDLPRLVGREDAQLGPS